jgi:hypothetical protein
VSCGIQESLLVVERCPSLTVRILFVCLGVRDLSLLLFGQLDLVNGLRLSWCDTKAELSLVLDLSNAIIVPCISSLQSVVI